MKRTKKWKKINGKWYKLETSSKKQVKFIPCNEDSQIYNWQRTNKKATQSSLDGVTGAIYKKPRGKVHAYLNRNKTEENE